MKSYIPFSIAYFIFNSAIAQPIGNYYIYTNPHTGRTQCSQSPISPDWVRMRGPYIGPDCKVQQSSTPESKPKEAPLLLQKPVTK